PHDPILAREHINCLFRNNFSPCIALFDLYQPLGWRGKGREFVNLPNVGPSNLSRLGKQWVQSEPNQRHGKCCPHDYGSESEQDAEKRTSAYRVSIWRSPERVVGLSHCNNQPLSKMNESYFAIAIRALII